jgi:peptide/nickel transport system substrate-binding protein
MTSPRKLVLGAMAVTAGSIVIAGCGSSGTSGSSGSASSSGSGSGSGTELSVAIPSVPTSFDIASSYQGVPSDYSVLSTNGALVRFKPLPAGAKGLQGPTDIEGELAQSWTRKANGSYEFTLRAAKDPAGNVVTSQDVDWSFRRELTLGGLGQYLANEGHISLKDPVTIINSKQFTLNVTSPSSLTLAVLPALPFGQIYDYAVVKPHITKADPWATKYLTDNTPEFGPYTLDPSSFSAGTSATLVANPNYWKKGEPYFKKVLLKGVADAGTRLALVKTGQIDFATALTFPLLKDIVDQKSPGVATDPTATASIDMLEFNDRNAPFNNPAVRDALSMAINRPSLVQSVYAGFGKPAMYNLTSVMQLPPEPAAKYTVYNPTKAKAMLASAGESHLSFTLTINSDSGPGPQAPSLAAALKAEFAAIGVTMNINTVASDSQFATGDSGGAKQFPALLYQIKPSVVDPSYDAGLTWDPAGLDLSDNTDKSITPLAEKINVTPDGATRNGYITQLEDILNNTLPTIPLVETVAPWVLKTGVTGAAPNPLGSIYFQDLK